MKTTNRPAKYNPGDYGCVDTSPDTPWGWFLVKMIKLATHSRFSHAFVIIDESGGIVEAEPFGAQYSHISKYDGREIQFSTTILTDDQRKQIVRTAINDIGTEYNFAGILYLALYLNGIKWQRLLNKIISLPDKFCSQLVAADGVSAGVDEWLCGKEYPQLVTPADLDRLAE